jgi:hypothetical protein
MPVPHPATTSTGGVAKGSGAAGHMAVSMRRRRFACAARVILPCLGMVIYGVSLALMPHDMFLWVFDSEYGPVEIGTAACWFTACALAFGLAVRTRGRAPAAVRVLYVVFALGALFAGLEEISYGQHLFGWQSPRWFVEKNAQHETNLHNLFSDKPTKTLRNAAIAGVTVGGIVLPAAAMWAGGQFAPGRFAYYLLPRSELIPLVTVTLLMRLFRTLPHGLREGRDTALFEMLELYVAITALLYVLIVRRRLLSVDTPRGDGA